MSGQVLQMAPSSAVNEAWDDYANLACELIADRSLIANRAFMEQLTKAEAKWKRLFLISEASR